MISVDKTAIAISGAEFAIRAEFCVLCKVLREIYAKRYSIEEADRMLAEDLDDAKKTVEDLRKEVEKFEAECGIAGVDSKLLDELLAEEETNG